MNTQKTNIKIKNCTVNVQIANGDFCEYHTNNNYINYNESQIADMFELEPLHYGTELEGAKLLQTFNTYNWNAPFTFCGVYSGDVYDDTPCIVNIHLGGDARGNYSKPYICNDMECILLQNTHANFELSNGEFFTIDSENSEGYFDLILDPYYINFDEFLTIEQYEELKEKQ